jgi:flagellar basal body-associated protein FliL
MNSLPPVIIIIIVVTLVAIAACYFLARIISKTQRQDPAVESIHHISYIDPGSRFLHLDVLSLIHV